MRERAHYLLLDTVGAALAGRSAEAVRQVRTLVPPVSRTPQDIALVLATACQALDLDETNLPARCHIAAAIVPALVATSMMVPCSGTDFMAALAAAYEFEGRLGRSLPSRHSSRGWHSSATLGTFGAAFAASCLLGLDEHGMRNALAIAATQASGVKAVFGGTAKPFNFGRAAQSGVIAARLAQTGMSAPADPFHAPDGFFAAAGALPFDADDQMAGHPLLDNHFKFLPFCIETHATALAVHSLTAANGRPDRLRIVLAPTARAMVDRPAPVDVDQARFSVQYVAASALAGAGRSPLPEPFDRDLLERTPPIEVVEDAGLAHLEARARGIYAADELTAGADLGATGHFDPGALSAKFDLMSGPSLGARHEHCRRLILALDRADSPSTLWKCMPELFE